MSFKNIIGHEKTINSLQNSIKTNKISHSYLFIGEESIGKKMVATVFAKTLLCNKNSILPWQKLNPLCKFETGKQPSFFPHEPKESKKKKKQNQKENKKKMKKPKKSEKKIFILEEN